MKTKAYRKSKKCLICGSSKLTKYLSLGKQAPANSYLKKDQLTKTELKFPLEVYFCQNCYLAQLLHIVDRALIFSDYAYFSSTSPMLVKHFEDYAHEVFDRFSKQSKQLVFDIGSNDGVLLKPFKKLGAKVLGIDPAKNVAKAANKEGIKTIPKFFSSSLVPSLIKKHKKAGVITSNNTLAHTDVLHDIFEGVREFLDEGGVFVFEVHHIVNILDKNEFDNTYHEHICYYSLWPIIHLLRLHSLDIFDVKLVETHGGSLRVYASHPFTFQMSASVRRLLNKERELGLDKVGTYLKFAKKPQKVQKKLTAMLKKLKSAGKKIAGYGASAKGTTLLQFCKIGPETIDYITDSAPSKQGTFTPGTHIPIVPPDILKTDTPDVIVIFAWNYAKNIMEKEDWFKKQGGQFIIPIPEPVVVA